MKMRTKTSIKMTNGRVNLDYTFEKGASLEKVAQELLTQLAFSESPQAVLTLANKVAESVGEKK